MEIKETNEKALGVHQALNVLQPRRQGVLAESPYDIGINKVSHALTRTYQKNKSIIDGIADMEGKYQQRKQELRKKVLATKSDTEERRLAEEKEQELVAEFGKWQAGMLEEEVTLVFHQVDFEGWKRSCRTPPFWVLDMLEPMWLHAKAPKDPFKITRADAYKFMKAVAEWLKAVPEHRLPVAQYQEAIAREEEKLRKKDISAEDRAESKSLKKRLESELETIQAQVFPVDIGVGLAIDLYWGFRCCREALKDFEAERDERLKRVDVWLKSQDSDGDAKTERAASDGIEGSDGPAGDGGIPSPEAKEESEDSLEPLSEEDYGKWEDEKMAEVIEVAGIKQLLYSDIPDSIGTPNGIVMDGLLAVLKED